MDGLRPDVRPDGLLEGAGRFYWRLNAAIAWTDGVYDDMQAKTCSRSGKASWKAAKPLREQTTTEDAAAGYFKERARRRNPCVTASGSGWDLVEYDGDRDELDAKHGIPRLPATFGWQSRRGPHFAYETPLGEAPVKVQVDEAGVTVWSDGYLVCWPAWRPEHELVYDSNGVTELSQLSGELRGLLLELAGQARAEARRRFAEGEPIPEGHRDVELFWQAVRLIRGGAGEQEALERLHRVNVGRCRPPLDTKAVEKQFVGAVKWARQHPTDAERAREMARRHLEERRAGVAGQAPVTLWLPFADVTLSGPIRWVWRGRLPEGAVTLLCGRPKLGKSLLSVWLAAQLSRGLLHGQAPANRGRRGRGAGRHARFKTAKAAKKHKRTPTWRSWRS